MTIRKAEIVSVKERGFIAEATGTMDGNPDRTEIRIKGVNCTSKEFIEWFLTSEAGSNFYSSTSATITDLGGSTMQAEVGSTLLVSYQQFITGKIAQMAATANSHINNQAVACINKINSCS